MSDENLQELIRLYQTKEMTNLRKLGSVFGIDKRKVKELLLENGCEYNDGRFKEEFEIIGVGTKYAETDDYTFIAKHKDSGLEFADFDNTNGKLSRHLKSIGFTDKQIPNKTEALKIYQKTGNYWWEKYFDVIIVDRNLNKSFEYKYNKNELNEGFEYVAIHKETFVEFKDVNNKHGMITKYLVDIGITDIPTNYMARRYYLDNGNYWWEKYFDVIQREYVKTKRDRETFLSEEDEKEIVRLYATNEMTNLYDICQKYHIGGPRCRQILKENFVDIIKGEKLKVYNGFTKLDKYKHIDDEYKYIGICKIDGRIFDFSYENTNQMTIHLKNIIPDFIEPTGVERKRYMFNTGDYWFEQYFEIKTIKKTENGYIKCPYCEEYLDISKSHMVYRNHLAKEHNIDILEHIKLYPEDKKLFKREIELEIDKLDKDKWIKCEICGKNFRVVGDKHLKKHGITSGEYKMKYGKTTSIYTNKLWSDSIIEINKNCITNTYSSKSELEILEYIKSLGFEASKNKKILNGKEIDILVEEKKLAIEFNGNRWHSEVFGKKTKFCHLDKTILANSKGLNLVHIFEDEWVRKKDIVKNKLKHLLNKSEDLPKIAGRKTIVKEINNYTSSDFLDNFHIQGSSNSFIYLGCYYNDLLIAVMTFKRLSKDKGDYDLTRFASDYNYVCQGVGSKLLKYFIKTYNPSSIISFADRRWTLNAEDNLYTKLGFKLDHILKPDYKYYNPSIDKYERFHKFGFRKSILSKKFGLPIEMTESEMAIKLGFDKIWDCGLYRYKMTFE